jgi:hypothetical protein
VRWPTKRYQSRLSVSEVMTIVIAFHGSGYRSQGLFESLFERGLELITKRRKNMKNALMPLLDKILLHKRPIIETVNDPLKNLC